MTTRATRGNRSTWGEDRIKATDLKGLGYTGPYKGLHKLLARHGTPGLMQAMCATHIGLTTEINGEQYTIADLYMDDLRRVMGVCMPYGTIARPSPTTPQTLQQERDEDGTVEALLALMDAEAIIATDEESVHA